MGNFCNNTYQQGIECHMRKMVHIMVDFFQVQKSTPYVQLFVVLVCADAKQTGEFDLYPLYNIVRFSYVQGLPALCTHWSLQTELDEVRHRHRIRFARPRAQITGIPEELY